jgi:hypothetical protein
LNSIKEAILPARVQGVISRLLDDLQGRGRLVASLPELAATSGLTPLAVSRQLAHLDDRVTRLPSRPSCFLITPPEHRLRGAPPIANWLGDYCRLRQQPYYVGLLSAAAMHGSGQQAVQITQVMTIAPTRTLILGRVHIEFHVKQNLVDTPLAQIKGLAAPLAVSSPEATALDLMSYQQSVGGVARAVEVIAGLLPAMTIEGWRRAVPLENTAVKQRMGYVLEALGAQKYAKILEASLPTKLHQVPLQSSTPSLGASCPAPWQIEDNIRLKELLT